MTTFAHSLVELFWRTQTKLKGLTPANGISPNFWRPQIFLSDSNNNFKKHTYIYDALTDEEIKSMESERNRVMETLTRTGINFQNQKFYKNNIEYKIRNGQLIR